MPPEVLARIGRLDLRARTVVDGVLAGLHKSPYKGNSVEFLQHREYTRGDDLRRVDWKVWGRQDRLYVKEFEDETNLRLFLLVDGSASMDYQPPRFAATQGLTKFDYAATLAASLAWLGLSQGDAVGTAVFDKQVTASVPARTSRSHLASLVKALEQPRQKQPSDFLAVLRGLAETLPRRGLVVLCSDLLGDREAIFKGLQLLRQRGHDLAIFHVLDDDELDFPFDGPTRFEGLELPEDLACNPRALRAGYLEAIDKFLVEARSRAAATRCDYHLVRASQPIDSVLVNFLARRNRLRA
ncbi:MAG: DUF58 domain-containing protein [Planctomycetia bacterium]|nr:DUF58 domain-containing protein [Planctomycetia bacterium]